MRVTHSTISTTVLAGLQGNINRLGETQQRMSTGKQISRPSDAPAGAVAAMELRTNMANNRQYARNADDGIGWLDAVEGALTSTLEQVNRARSLVQQGMSTVNSGSAASREALAVELESLRSSMIGVANTTYLDRPVFGGTTAGKLALAADGSYAGDDGAVLRTVGNNTKVRVDMSGEEVFGTGPAQLFTVMGNLADKMRTDPAGLAADLARLDTAISTVQTGLSSVGARYNQVERSRQAADDMVFNLTKSLSDIEDIDLPKTITDLSLQQTAYQAALAAGARVMQTSLIDFLR